MKIWFLHPIAAMAVSLTLLTGLGMAAPLTQTPGPADEPLAMPGDVVEEHPFDLKEAVSRSTINAALQGGLIEIATLNWEVHSGKPTVALCSSDEYLVVFVDNGAIYGQRLESDGSLLGSRFLISSGGTDRADYPDVACDWSYNRFLVTWEYDFNGDGSDYDLRVRGVMGGHQTSGSQLYGSELWLASTLQNETKPAIACNSNDHTCLVAFENDGSGNGDISGQRVSIGSSGISSEGSLFTIGGYAAAEQNPDVAWGGYDDDYLVVWEYLHDTPSNHYRILVSYVWNTDQVGSQIETAPAYLIGPGTYDDDQTRPAAAYNCNTRQYLTVFEYDSDGPAGYDTDIKALRLMPGGGAVGTVFDVAGTAADAEYAPAVAFSGGTQSLPGGMGTDQFLVTFQLTQAPYTSLDGDGYYGQAVKGTYATSGSQLEGDRVLIGWPYDYGSDPSAVIGSINNGRYMAVLSPSDEYSNVRVLGRIIAPEAVYLPLVLSD